ncbi:MAG: DNA replication/repair protein RecF [Patescibacteria group bacterium]|nr:DNA replication/repair protein RecF [Patescibacteria group bacterium]
MFLSKLELTNFRNIKNLRLGLPNSPVIFYGQNAQGKTNILESIYLLSSIKSFRADKDSQLVRVGQNFARVWGKVDSSEVEIVVSLLKGNLLSPGWMTNASLEQITPDEHNHAPGGNFPTKKEIKVNKTKKKALEALGEIKAVLFSPEDINILTGPPADRRRFLDVLISAVDRKYLFTLAAYQKAIKSRNRVLWWLKEGRKENLEIWDEQVVSLGAAIWLRRREVVEQLNGLLGPISQGIQEACLQIKYQPGLAEVSKDKTITEALLKAHFLKELSRHQEGDIRRTTTSTGPHRDDFSVVSKRLEVASTESNLEEEILSDVAVYGSRGEQRAAILALKLAELAFEEKESGQKPILLLDDVLSEFDESHRQHLLSLVSKQQTLITATSLDMISQNVLDKAKVFQVKEGIIKED